MNRSSALSFSSVIALAAFALPADVAAQTVEIDSASPGFQTPGITPPPASIASATNAPDEVQFSAEQVNYDNEGNILVAEGTVFLERDGQRLRADKVEWNRTTGQVVAMGNVVAGGGHAVGVVAHIAHHARQAHLHGVQGVEQLCDFVLAAHFGSDREVATGHRL